MSFTRELELRHRAAYPCVYVVAREDWRCVQEIEKLAKSIKEPFALWTVTKGEPQDPKEALKSCVAVQQGKDIVARTGFYVFVNFHRFLDDPEMIQTTKDIVQVAKNAGLTIVFVCNVYKLPDELQDDISRLEFTLPDKELLYERVDFLLESTEGIRKPTLDERERIAESALGMTTAEAENAMALSVIETGKRGEIDPKIVAREKARAVSKNGILEFYEPQVGMSDIGGLANLKTWLSMRKDAFSKEARAYGLPDLRGILLVGVPGCGKSLTAKAVSSEWGIPLLRFDVGRLFQGLVGASEENVRKAIATAEAVAPVVLWIDEIEKGLAGMGGSGSTDSGVTARVFGTLLSWMQERQRPVFVVATANNVSNLPPELMRAGRWDEIFSVDLPSYEERIEVLKIHLKKRKRDPEQFNLEYIAKESAQFSPAELESVIVKAMFIGFSSKREITTEDLMEALTQTVPLSVTRREDIEAMRTWAATRAVPASSAEPPRISEASEVGNRRKLRFITEVQEVDGDGN